MTGRFDSGRGSFTGSGADGAEKRFDLTTDAPGGPHWEHSTATDAGRSWQTDWITELGSRQTSTVAAEASAS